MEQNNLIVYYLLEKTDPYIVFLLSNFWYTIKELTSYWKTKPYVFVFFNQEKEEEVLNYSYFFKGSLHHFVAMFEQTTLASWG
jgi:hypothetical protein